MKIPAALALTSLVFSPACHAATNPWNGTWKLDRSRPEPDGAADDYRFAVGPDDTLLWEIPSLKEANFGRLDGTPMTINRPGGAADMTIIVKPEAPRVWHYQVRRNGESRGEAV